jgi:hypothetical protein
MLILIPLPLFFASTIFGVRGLTAWVVIGILWCFCSAITVVLYPLWESRVALVQITSGVVKVRPPVAKLCKVLNSVSFRAGHLCKGKREACCGPASVWGVAVHAMLHHLE